MGEERKEPELPRPYKQCPDCLERLPLDVKKCTQCGRRVGKIMKDGKAKKPVDWIAYVVSAILFAVFYFFMKWAFFSD